MPKVALFETRRVEGERAQDRVTVKNQLVSIGLPPALTSWARKVMDPCGQLALCQELTDEVVVGAVEPEAGLA